MQALLRWFSEKMEGQSDQGRKGSESQVERRVCASDLRFGQKPWNLDGRNCRAGSAQTGFER